MPCTHQQAILCVNNLALCAKYIDPPPVGHPNTRVTVGCMQPIREFGIFDDGRIQSLENWHV